MNKRYVYGKVFTCRCTAEKFERRSIFKSEDKSLIDFKRCPHCEARLMYEFKEESPDQENVNELLDT